MINPHVFHFHDEKDKVLIVVSIISLSLIFPIITIMMMRALGMVQSLQMPDRQERIGPLISASIFYLWLFINIKDHPFVPQALVIFTLGSVISLFIAFFINNFSKVSLHTTGIGGFFAMMLIARFFYSYESFNLNFGAVSYQISTNILVFLGALIAGAVGTSRLFLKAHSTQEVFGGYMIGLFGQLIAFRILFE